MTTEAEKACLNRIYDRLHPFIEPAATKWKHRPEVLAGIAMRESRGGEALDGDGLGDNTHGHGIMQIDDRSFPDFCRGDNWSDPEVNIDYGAIVLADKIHYLSSRVMLTGDQLEQAAIAAYNCGEGRVLYAIQRGEDIDSYTSHHDYSRCVLAYAETYRQIIQERAIPEPGPEPDRASGGFWGDFFALIASAFRRKPS